MTSQSDKSGFRQARDTIYTFFYYLNKPVGVSEIILQFKNYKKSMVEQVLDDLVAKNKIFFKMFGKSKIYCLTQNMNFEIDETVYTEEIDNAQDQTLDDKVLRYLKWNFERNSKELTDLKEESKRLDSQLSIYENQMSVEDLTRAIEDLKLGISEYEGQDKNEIVDTADFNKRKKEHMVVKKELTKRSNIFKEMVDQLCDGLGKSKSVLFKEIGLEE